MLQGIKLGVSSRGWASVVTDPHSKQVVVEPDYQLITFDFVPEPSNAGAYVVPICKRYRYAAGMLLPQAHVGSADPVASCVRGQSLHALVVSSLVGGAVGTMHASLALTVVGAAALCFFCRKRLPDQAAAVSISYLGIGSISMANLQSLPPASVLRKWLKHSSRAMDAAAKHPGQVSSGCRQQHWQRQA